MKIKVSNANTPNWKEVTVKSHIPEELKKLEEMARNIWWAWNYEATDLFRDLDPATWKEVGQNPVALLERLSYEKLEALTQDKVIVKRMNDVYAKFKAYVDAKPDSKRPSVAYFCMEYGLTHVLKIYSGGLGILAGDYLKEASDSNVDMCGVGFLYRYGYFSQSLSMDGQQIANYESQNFGSLPIERVMDENGQPMVVDVPYLNYFVHAYVWKVNVGRVPLYLLDTDNEMNSEFDRPITYQLYGGDWENRLKQEILLGIGGVLLLKKLGIKKDVYHCNEGHAALCNVQRLCDYVESGLTFDQALEVVRSSSLYTVHTPVPAGHDYFDEGLFGKYMGGYPQRMGISWQDLMDLGRINPGDAGERFCMSTFACNTCQEVNGVSWLHGKVSQEMFSGIWKGYFPEESHVGYVTNGVHFPTWSATEWKKLYAKHFAPNFLEDQSNEKIWEAIYNVADEEIWETRMALKYKLVDHIRKQFSESWLKNQGDPSRIVSLMEKINPNALLIGFARRFATYKRAHLLFTDLERLSKIVNNPDYPVQFLFAGKAHPHDGAGQGLIKKIVEISRRPEFLGKIIFLENYDMQLARRLVSGVDIWMNTPTRPLEASGTSGEKALMNGVVNFSVLDGWWLEGYREGAGWALTEKRTYQNQDHQDQLDAATKGLVRELLELSSQLPGGMDDVCVARGQADTSALADAYRAALGASKAATEKAQVALDAIDAFEASGKTMEDAARLMMSCSMPRASKAFSKEQVELLKAEAADAFINIVLACGGPALDALAGLARAVEAEYRALKADQSALDNNDLLRMAYEALRDYPAIRAAYEGRFKMVMIDEFQDTDQMQVDLIRHLTGAGERALCTVGDAQQSIYRFRGAEVEVFRRQERKVGSTTASETVATSDAPAGELVKLVRNFRSHDEVLRYVARVFDGDTGGLMQGFLDLEPSDEREDKLKAKASRRQAIFVAGGSTQERTQAKARAIAERFQALVKAGQPQGSMVLLLGRMTNADVYAQAFRDQGLDCVIAGGSVFAQAAEVQTVRALVCALANPADTAQGLMPLLASPMFALGAQEFLALATKLDDQIGRASCRERV